MEKDGDTHRDTQMEADGWTQGSQGAKKKKVEREKGETERQK